MTDQHPLVTSEEYTHRYISTERIIRADTPNISINTIFDGLTRFPAIGGGQPVVTGTVSQLPGITSPNPVYHIVDSSTLSVTNVTLPGHLFDGIVHRTVTIENGWYVIKTLGVGNAPENFLLLEESNEILGPAIFEFSKSDIIDYVLEQGGSEALEHHIGEELALRGVQFIEVDGVSYVINNDGTFSNALFPEFDNSIRDIENCFLAGTMIGMWPEGVKANANGLYDEKEVLAKVWKKPIEQITADDNVLSYDKDGNLKPGKVTRTFQNKAKHILDFHGLMMTPGHATFCAEGKFKGQHVPIIDILRSDGCIQKADGTIIRAATNCPINSAGDRFIWAITGETKDGVTKVAEKGKIRLGTRTITPEGNDVSVLDMIMAHDVVITKEGLIKHNANDPSGMPFRWSFGDKLPKPEDYIMQRSELTTQDIYQHGEWERAFPPQMPAPFAGEAGGSYKPDPVLQASALPNIPLSMRNSPNQPTMSRKQRRAMEAKKRKTKKQSNVTLH